jgi:NTE family protein
VNPEPEATERESAAAKYLPAPEPEREGIALCLSGGGYRAALFHLGVLRRLDELGTMSRVETVSAVSGGSILAAYLAQELGEWPESSGPIPGFATKVVPGFRELTRKNIRTLWALRRALPWNWVDTTVAVETLVSRYEKDVVRLKLSELPRRPRYIFCASDLSFGTSWVSERRRVGTYQSGYVNPPPDWSVARAVAASSCFPPVFDPLPVGLEPELFADGLYSREDRDELIAGMRLTDGGVYDNMALEPVWKRHAVVLVSDGGATFDPSVVAPIWRPFKRLGRYLEVQGRQAGAVRRRWLVGSFLKGELSGVYLGLGSDVRRFDERAPGYDRDLVDEVIANVRTDLDYFSDAEAAVLQNHGYLLADAAMRTHAPGLMTATELQTPYPDWMDAAKVRRALAKSDKRTPVIGRWRLVAGARDTVRELPGRLKRLFRRR